MKQTCTAVARPSTPPPPTGCRPPPPPNSERVPFDTDLPFEELTFRALDLAREVPEVYGSLLAILEDCRPLDPPTPEQQRGASYKQLAFIGHLSGMDKAGRSGWYRVAERIPLTELHALYIVWCSSSINQEVT